MPNNQTFLNSQINQLKVKKSSLEKEFERNQTLAAQAAGPNVTTGSAELGVILVNNYAWDQEQAFIKIYIEVDKNQKIEDSQLSLKFTSKTSFTCVFGKYRVTIGRLYKDVNTEKSTVKVTKSNRVIITLYKATPESWASLQVKAGNFSNKLENDKDLATDPNAGMMKLMKTMYDEGDDEMKRTIAKSWYESSQNKQAGFDPSQMNI